MRHVYSVVRFVPDAARGEAVNIGIVAGSDESREWDLRTVENLKRARSIDDEHVLPGVVGHLAAVSAKLEAFTDQDKYLMPPKGVEDISEGWLSRLSADSANVVQFTPPRPIVADSVDDAIEDLWDELIIDPAFKRYKFQKKHRAVSAVASAFRERRILAENLWSKSRVNTQQYAASMDFVVHNGRVSQLTNCWSFQLPDKEALAEELKAWAWTVRDLRVAGGSATSPEGQRLEIDPQVPIAVVFVPPVSDDDSRVFEQAEAAFADDDVRVRAVPFTEASTIADEAAERI